MEFCENSFIIPQKILLTKLLACKAVLHDKFSWGISQIGPSFKAFKVGINLATKTFKKAVLSDYADKVVI